MSGGRLRPVSRGEPGVGRNENAGSSRARVAALVLALTVAGIAAVTGAVRIAGPRWPGGGSARAAADPARCPRVARVVAPTSFAPVLRNLASELARGDQCVRVDLTEADGRGAVSVAHDKNADVWIA